MDHPFKKDFPATYNKKGSKELSIGTDNGIPVYITEEGKVKAKGFIDTNDELELQTRGVDVVATHKINKFVHAHTTLNSEKNQRFLAKAPIYHVFINVFKKIVGILVPSLYKAAPFIRFLPKALKKKILSTSSNYPFYLEQKVGDKLYTRPIIRGFWNKAYETPVKIAVPNGLDFISDILVIKTGCFNYVNITGTGAGLPKVRSGIKEEKIVYVSPHDEIPTTGYITGVRNFQRLNATGGNATFSGASGIEPYLQLTGLNFISSISYSIPSGSIISGGMSYLKTNAPMVSAESIYNTPDLTGTLLYQLYSGHRGIFNTGARWSGVIPSGVPFKIEIWSFNGVVRGFHGQIQVMPITTAKTIEASILTVGEGASSSNNVEALKLALRDSNHKAQNAIEAALVDKGILQKNSKIRKYTAFIQGANNTTPEQNTIQVEFPSIEDDIL